MYANSEGGPENLLFSQLCPENYMRRVCWGASVPGAPLGSTNDNDCHVTRTPPPSSNKAAHSGFEIQRRCHQRSKMGVSVAPRKDSCPPKI